MPRGREEEKHTAKKASSTTSLFRGEEKWAIFYVQLFDDLEMKYFAKQANLKIL